MMARSKRGSQSPFIAAVSKIKGVMFCLGCRSWRYPHVCDGTPAVSLRWEWAYSTGYVGTPHHDPIDPQWSELEAEDANNQPQEAA